MQNLVQQKSYGLVKRFTFKPFWPVITGISLSLCTPAYASGAIKTCLARKLKTEDTVVACTRQDIAMMLGWVEERPITTICGGYYVEPNWLADQSDLTDPDDVQITADEVSLFNAGRSTATGHVVIDQTGKQVTADTATIYRDDKSGDVTHIHLAGNVTLREPRRMLISREAEFDNVNQNGSLLDVLYRSVLPRKANSLNAWGQAKTVHRDAQGTYILRQATYATCPPLTRSWSLKARKLILNQKENKGVAKDTLFKVRGLPLLYLPYMSFPLDNARKSGFLSPLIGYNNRNGSDISLPYYLNIAPNLDMTVSPRYLSQRGGMVEGELRYLTSNTHGIIAGGFLPRDKRFRAFLDNNNLPNSGTDRAAVHWTGRTDFNKNWSATADVHYVSDDYYFQDFGTSLASTTTNQLIRRGSLLYSDQHWSWSTNLVGYQTLNPINQLPTAKIFERLPQVVLNGNFPDFLGPLSFRIANEYDYFLDGPIQPDGNRLTSIPALTMGVSKPVGFFRATAELHASAYRLRSLPVGVQRDFDRTIPRYYVDGGLFFERDMHLGRTDYIQTLEPRLFFLYVPFEEQSQIPIFDSSTYVFNYAQLFRTNRFSGWDRIGDANQLTAAITTRMLNGDTGDERFRFSVGTIFYFDDRQVQLCSGLGCTQPPTLSGYQDPTAEVSPIVADTAIGLIPGWSLQGHVAWDPKLRETNNAAAHLHYQSDPLHIIDIGYSYLVNGDIDPNGALSPNANNDLHQVRVGAAWPLSQEWSILGNWSYNINKDYNLSYYAGLQYDSCCWAFRVLAGRIYTQLDKQFVPLYQNAIYVQFLLRGLGTVGNQNPSQVLSTIIPGYHDIFH